MPSTSGVCVLLGIKWHQFVWNDDVWSETPSPYAPQGSRYGSEPLCVEDAVDVRRYAILELHARNDDDELCTCACGCVFMFVFLLLCAAIDSASCSMPSDKNLCDIWLSVKSTVDSSGSIFIYSYEGHECVSAKVVPRTLHISSSLSSQHYCIVSDWSHLPWRPPCGPAFYYYYFFFFIIIIIIKYIYIAQDWEEAANVLNLCSFYVLCYQLGLFVIFTSATSLICQLMTDFDWQELKTDIVGIVSAMCVTHTDIWCAVADTATVHIFRYKFTYLLFLCSLFYMSPKPEMPNYGLWRQMSLQ